MDVNGRALFRNEVLLRLLFSIIIVLMSLVLIINYSEYTNLVTPENERDNTFSGITNNIMSSTVILDIILIFYNTNNNYRYRNFRIKGQVEQPLILYILCLPMIILAMIGLIMFCINHTLVWFPLLMDTSVSSVVVFLEFFAIIVLVLDISGFKDTGEKWSLNYSNCLTIAVTITSLLMQVIYNVVMKQVRVFSESIQTFLNFSLFNNHRKNESIFNNDRLAFIINVKKNTIVMLLIVFTPYLLIPLKRNFKHLMKYNLELIPLPVLTVVQSNKRPLFSVPGTIFVILFILMNTTLMVYEIVETTHESNTIKCFHIIVNFFIFALIISTIREMQTWQRRKYIHYFKLKHSLMYLGLLGQSTALLANVIVDSYQLTRDVKYTDMYRYLFIFLNLQKWLIGFLSTSLMSMMLERVPKLFHFSSWNHFFCSPLVLVIWNVEMFVYELLMLLHNSLTCQFQLKLLLLGIVAFGRPCAMLFRLVSVLIYSSVFMQLNKNPPN